MSKHDDDQRPKGTATKLLADAKPGDPNWHRLALRIPFTRRVDLIIAGRQRHVETPVMTETPCVRRALLRHDDHRFIDRLAIASQHGAAQ